MTSRAARAMSENGPGGLREKVRALCDGLKLTASHYPDSRLCWMTGEPDLRLYGSRLVHVELKAEDGQLSLAQRRVRRLIEDSGGEYRLWRPSDLLSGAVADELTGLSDLRVATFFTGRTTR